jgi:hypothetical protein
MVGNRSVRLRTIALALGALLLVPSVCVAQPEDLETAAGRFLDLSEKEHCITNLMLSYAKKDIERFSELLHDDYLYHGFDNIVIWGKQEERENTELLFEKEMVASFTIGDGSWTKTDRIGESPCGDCWESTRQYSISGHVSGDDTTVFGSGYARFVVKRVERNGEPGYRIVAIIDLGKEPPE